MKTLQIIIVMMLLTNLSFSQEFEDSPFGINNFYYPFLVAQVEGISTPEELDIALNEEKIPIFLDLGAANGRIHPESFGSMSFGNIDRDRNGADLDFSLQDVYVRNAQDNQIRLLLSLGPFVSTSPPEWTTTDSFIPDDTLAYRAYVRATVERYDGDGSDDMPGLAAPVKFWQLDNEADLHYKRRGSGDFESPDEYFRVLRMTWEELKIADQDARLMINLAGLGQGIDFASDYLQALIGLGALNYFDILSYHVYPAAYNFSDVRSFHDTMTAIVTTKPVWITETAITSKSVDGFADSAIASETNQAIWLIKNYLYHIANGVKNVLWLNYDDFAPNVNAMMKYGGLMTFSDHQKKLSYYTYKLMVEKLEGSDWDNIQTLIDGTDNVYAYKFTKAETGEPVYVAWWDYYEDPDYSEGDTKIVSIEVEDTDTVRVTQAVPTAENGAELDENDYPSFFASETLKVINGTVTITLGINPVFVEKLSSTTSVEEETNSFVPGVFRLEQNYPNPFNSTTTISYGIPHSVHVTLTIYDLTGNSVITLVEKQQAAGRHEVQWNGLNRLGQPASPGVYAMRLQAGKFIMTKKIFLMK